MQIKFWLNNARTVALPQSVTPAVASICFAAGSVAQHRALGDAMADNIHFSLLLSLVALVGVICAHLSVNLFDDYFDYKNAGLESRQRLHRAGMRARIAKATYLAEGQATMKQTRVAACTFATIAIVMGVVCFAFRGWLVLALAAVGGILGFFYSAKPLALGYRGLGELVTGLIFGPLLMLGVSYAACGYFPEGIGYAGCAIGLLVINILYTHSIMDADADRSVSKQTLATLLATPKKMLIASAVFNFFPFVLIILGVALSLLSPWFLLTLLTMPMGLKLFMLMRQFVHEKQTSVAGQPSRDNPLQRHWWMGPMDNWNAIVESDLDWFMLRWYLARNYLTFFVIITAIVAFF